jgi:Mrp family chromosome partitioning ATPase/capsular polysaccharide biosynthesis protein
MPPPGNPAPPAQQGALGPYLRAIVAHPVIVAVVMLLTLAGSVAWLTHRATNYQTTADILFTAVSSGNGAADGLPLLRESADPTRETQTAATLLDSPQAAVIAARQAGHGLTPAAIRQAISVEPQGQSDIIAITAKATSAKLAQQIANAYAAGSLRAHRELLRTQTTGLLPTSKPSTLGTTTAAQEREALIAALARGEDPNFSLSQAATLPASPTGTSKALILILALVAGFALGSGAAIATEMLSDRVRESDELLRIYDLPVLAYIPELSRRNRANTKRLSTNGDRPPTPPLIREAFQMVRVQLDTKVGDSAAVGHVILLTSGSGSDGKTTSAINIATALADAGHRVILMDLDLRKPDLGRSMRLEREAGVTALIDTSTELRLVLTPHAHVPRLSVVPAGREAGEHMLAPVMSRLPVLLKQARSIADYIVIDAPPLGEVSDAYQLLPLVDEVIVVARPGNTRRGSFEFMRELLNRARRTPFGMVIVGETGHHTSYAYYGQGQ